jgi:hypothetical protein
VHSRDESLGLAIYGASLTLSEVQPGDIGVAHSSGAIGWLIRFFTRSTWNHVFAFVEVPANPTPETVVVIQAEAHGVMCTTLDKVAPGGSYAILRCPAGVDRVKVVAMALSLQRTKYAFVSIASIFFNFLPWLPIRLDVRENGTLICSAVGALALLAGGWLHPWPDYYQVTPAQLATALAA